LKGLPPDLDQAEGVGRVGDEALAAPDADAFVDRLGDHVVVRIARLADGAFDLGDPVNHDRWFCQGLPSPNAGGFCGLAVTFRLAAACQRKNLGAGVAGETHGASDDRQETCLHAVRSITRHPPEATKPDN